MIAATATATEMQNNFGRYLNLVLNGQEIIVTKNGREVGRFIPKGAAVSYLTDSCTAILSLTKQNRKGWQKSMVLLIDANIVLDVLLNRPEFVKESSLVWKLCETEQAKGYISALTFANLVYIMRKQLTPEKIEDVLQRLGLIFEFADLTSADVSKAAALHWADFEDAVQSVTAERIHANYIITRNVRDFTKSSVMAFTPAELLARV